MPTMSSSRSSHNRPRPRGGAAACGGSGPRSSAAGEVIRRKVAIARTNRQVAPIRNAYPDLHAPEATVVAHVGGNVADRIPAANVRGDLLEGRDHVLLRAGEVRDAAGDGGEIAQHLAIAVPVGTARQGVGDRVN